MIIELIPELGNNFVTSQDDSIGNFFNLNSEFRVVEATTKNKICLLR